MAVQHIQPIRLSVGGKSSSKYVYAKQGDSISRFVLVTLISGDKQLIPEDGASAEIRAILPDDSKITAEATITAEGRILAEITKDMLSQKGLVKADVAIHGISGEVLSTEVFNIQVQEAPTF